MTEANVELARQMTDAWNRDDWEFMDGMFWPDREQAMRAAGRAS